MHPAVLRAGPVLQSECHPDTCTQMTATEQWIFLCAAHKTPKEVSVDSLHWAYLFVVKAVHFVDILCICVVLLNPQCPAIDYTRHTLDGAACLLNSNKYFPSRSVVLVLWCAVTPFLATWGDGNHLKIQDCNIVVILLLLQYFFCYPVFILLCFILVLICFALIKFKHSQYRLTERKIQSSTLDCKNI